MDKIKTLKEGFAHFGEVTQTKMENKKEFNLSDKRKELLNYFKEQFGYDSKIPDDIIRVVINQDKEFIKNLKKELKFMPHWNRVEKTIDKLAGDKFAVIE